LEHAIKNDGKKLHATLHCKTCGIVWNRDVMASKTMWDIVWSIWRGEERPDAFKPPTSRARTTTSTACSLPRNYLEVVFNIYGVSEMMTRNVELSSINLYRLDLHLKPQTYLKIKTNMDNRTRYFHTPHVLMSGINWKAADHRCVWGTLGQIAHEEATETSHKMVSLEFNSVKTIYINNKVAT
jgi:hypothetical protein